jgi:hypothetical protein
MNYFLDEDAGRWYFDGMARPLRIDQEDTFYHVLNRGNERRASFRDVLDCEGFLARLGRYSERFSLEEAQWCSWAAVSNVIRESPE